MFCQQRESVMRSRVLFFVAVAGVLAGCGGGMGSAVAPVAPDAHSLARQHRANSSGGPYGYIQHVVIIVQENRSFDDLFNGFPGANTVKSGLNSKGQVVDLQPYALDGSFDLSHKHIAFTTEYAGGNLNGFNLEKSTCGRSQSIEPTKLSCPPKDIAAYGYVPESDVQPYWDMASQYTIADNMFETNQGPSFPAHQYLISGTSTVNYSSTLRASENPVGPNAHKTEGGCDSKAGSYVEVIDEYGNEDQTVFPCFSRISLMGEANANYVSWKYYVAKVGPGLWNAPDAISEIRYGSSYANVVAPPSQVLTDIYNGQLASIVWVTPTAAASDHPASNNGTGPSWVASVVNAIGNSQYWYNTAIFVTWDDWGGWYDHVTPPIFNSYEDSFRVPLLVISPYANNGYISHVQHEFGSILKFTEEAFNLPSMGTTDERSDDLSDCFNFGSALHRHRFKTIRAKYGPQYFLHQPPSNESPDDDW
jgi:phospholipase C